MQKYVYRYTVRTHEDHAPAIKSVADLVNQHPHLCASVIKYARDEMARANAKYWAQQAANVR